MRRKAQDKAATTRRPSAAAATKRNRPSVATTIRRLAGQATNARQRREAPKPLPPEARRQGWVTLPAQPMDTVSAPTGAEGGMWMSDSAMKQMLDLAQQMVQVASKYERHQGVMDTLEKEYKLLGEVSRTVADAWKTLHDRATDPTTGDPLPPSVMELLAELHRHQMVMAATADQVAPLAKRLEAARIEALRDPRNRQWDHRANQDYTS